jgi:hypothetical protein
MSPVKDLIKKNDGSQGQAQGPGITMGVASPRKSYRLCANLSRALARFRCIFASARPEPGKVYHIPLTGWGDPHLVTDVQTSQAESATIQARRDFVTPVKPDTYPHDRQRNRPEASFFHRYDYATSTAKSAMDLRGQEDEHEKDQSGVFQGHDLWCSLSVAAAGAVLPGTTWIFPLPLSATYMMPLRNVTAVGFRNASSPTFLITDTSLPSSENS